MGCVGCDIEFSDKIAKQTVELKAEIASNLRRISTLEERISAVTLEHTMLIADNDSRYQLQIKELELEVRYSKILYYRIAVFKLKLTIEL